MNDQLHVRYATFATRGTAADGLTLEGHAAVFNADTIIEDVSGPFVESIAPGAFKRSLGQRMPVLQFDHGSHPVLGSLPIGAIRAIREDEHGLYVRATLADNWMVKPVRDAIASGAINGMSFRFRVIHDEWDDTHPDGMPRRKLTELEVAEVGPVVFPAYPQTSVSVRADNSLAAATTEHFRSAETVRALVLDPAPQGTSSADPPPPSEGTGQQDDPVGDDHSSLTRKQMARHLRVIETRVAVATRRELHP